MSRAQVDGDLVHGNPADDGIRAAVASYTAISVGEGAG